MPADDIYELSVVGSMQGQQVIHTFHMRQLVADASLAGNPGDPPADLYGSWYNAARTHFLALMPNASASPGGFTLDEVRIVQAFPYGHVPAAARTFEEGIAGTRTVTSEVLAPWIVAHASVKTNKGGRRYRGRFFVSGITEADVSGDQLLVATGTFEQLLELYVTADGMANFLPGGTVADWRLGVFSRRLAGFPPAPSRSGAVPPFIAAPATAVLAFTDATSLQVHQRASSLRSRRAR